MENKLSAGALMEQKWLISIRYNSLQVTSYKGLRKGKLSLEGSHCYYHCYCPALSPKSCNVQKHRLLLTDAHTLPEFFRLPVGGNMIPEGGAIPWISAHSLISECLSCLSYTLRSSSVWIAVAST